MSVGFFLFFFWFILALVIEIRLLLHCIRRIHIFCNYRQPGFLVDH